MSRHSPRRPARRIALAAVVASVVGCGVADARVHLSQDRALALAFGEGASVERRSVILTDAQLNAARAAAGPGVDVPSALVTRYEGRRDGASLGFAYFDAHVVRTLPESLMIVVAPDGSVSRIEVLLFAEPEDYLPKPRWLEQFRGRVLDREMSLKRSVHGITGATISARAVTDATRRVLAIHRSLAAPSGATR